MKDGYIRVGAVSPEIRVGDVEGNTICCIESAHRASADGVRVLSFPELCLTGATAGDLFFQHTLVAAAEAGLKKYAEQTRELDLISFIGLPASIMGRLYNVVCALCRGRLLAIIPKQSPSAAESRYFAAAPDENITVNFAGQEAVFGDSVIIASEQLSALRIGVCVGSDRSLLYPTSRYLSALGATVIINPSSDRELVGFSDKLFRQAGAESEQMCAGLVICQAGEGESGTDAVYSGRNLVAERGKILAAAEPFTDGSIIYAELDVTALDAERMRSNNNFQPYLETEAETVFFSLGWCDTELSRRPERLPFVPADNEALDARCKEILNIQCHALADRIRRSHSSGAVIGVSGGLDSTLAVLAAAGALDLLGMERTRLTAITMPCFGTTVRTKGNAERLSEALGATLRCIDIKASVTRHFEDIGHATDDFSVVYENAQARERTQVLMDVANATGALVVGTGDLSELALGWATYNGDHMSMYGVNAAIPKTLMRYLVAFCADFCQREGKTVIAEVLRDVLATPVSPELLPPKDGEISQCTEGIVGPYELHDFFLYYHVRYGFAPSKILRLAAAAFEGEYEVETIRGWLRVFLRRFFNQQFKRSCLPDGPAVGSVSLSPRGGFIMPSDAVGELWQKNIEG